MSTERFNAQAESSAAVGEPIGRQRAFAQVCMLLDPFRPGGNGAQRVGSATAAELLYAFACFHGVRPALLKALSLGSELTPDLAQLRSKLAEFQMLHRFEVLQTTGQIVDLAKRLEAAGIAALFFKGAVLGEQIYGGAQFREFNDIDLLVRPADRDCAIGQLEALDFKPIIPDTHMRRSFFDYFRQHSFRSRETGAVVDLHWAFVGTGPFPVTTEQALLSRTDVVLGGAAIPAPSRETQALILAGHGHKENWASFSWILDFATFAAVNPDLAWDRIAGLASAQRCLEPLLGAIMLVERVFGHTLDPCLAQLGAGRPHLIRNVETIVARAIDLSERQKAEELMGGFRLCETPTQKLNMALALLLTPTIGDFEAMPLPRRWWWIYRLTRPLRLSWRKLRGRAPNRSGGLVSV